MSPKLDALASYGTCDQNTAGAAPSLVCVSDCLQVPTSSLQRTCVLIGQLQD